jgi:hypothetical protein
MAVNALRHRIVVTMRRNAAVGDAAWLTGMHLDGAIP